MLISLKTLTNTVIVVLKQSMLKTKNIKKNKTVYVVDSADQLKKKLGDAA